MQSKRSLKAFDCIRHDLLIAKLNAYGFGNDISKLLYRYLADRKQRVKINGTYSEWKIVSHGVPQGSVEGPLLFNTLKYATMQMTGQFSRVIYNKNQKVLRRRC